MFVDYMYVKNGPLNKKKKMAALFCKALTFLVNSSMQIFQNESGSNHIKITVIFSQAIKSVK